MNIPMVLPLGLGALLFGLGLWGALTRTNAVRILMFIELMLNGVNLNLITFSSYRYSEISSRGPILTLFVMPVAAAEASVGLAIILNLVRSRHTVDVDKVDMLKG